MESLSGQTALWRGFNVLDFLDLNNRFQTSLQLIGLIAQWGFNFLRIPLDYRIWTDEDNSFSFYPNRLSAVSALVEEALNRKLHVCIAMHTAPGYSVLSSFRATNGDLWTSRSNELAFVYQWAKLAEYFQPYDRLDVSYNLLNEPPAESEVFDRLRYDSLMKETIKTIRASQKDRILVVDGIEWGKTPPGTIEDPHVVYSCRGYIPFQLTHYKAPWIEGQDDATPSWPLRFSTNQKTFDKAGLMSKYKNWLALCQSGFAVHCGEMGCFNKTPHAVTLAWIEDLLQIFRSAGIGWALWNLEGPFGIVNSGRQDAVYQSCSFGQLDVELLTLLQKY